MELIASRTPITIRSMSGGRAFWHYASARCYYHWQRLRMQRAHCPRELLLTSPHARYPLVCRTGSSDIDVYRQIFVRRNYAHLDAISNCRFIIDCGANVGYASAYFLSRFPDANVVAIEPDPDNFATLVRNLAPYGTRAQAIHAAVWSHETELMMVSQRYRDGREWSRQVMPCTAETAGGVPAMEIGALLEASGGTRISILKMDIEGAETEVFSAENLSWLNCVDHMAIELHDDSDFGAATPIVLPVLQRYGFKLQATRIPRARQMCRTEHVFLMATDPG